MAKRIKIGFFQVNMPAGCAVSFEDVLNDVAALDPEDRNVDLRECPIRLQELAQWQGHNALEGEMMKIRMDVVPVKAGRDGHTESFDFDDDEGVGEEAAFLYYPPTRTLVVQKNRYGVSPSAMAYYFEQKGSLQEHVEFIPIVELDALRRLAHMRIMRSFEFRIAGDANLRVFAQPDDGVGQSIDMRDNLHAPVVSVRLSMPRGSRHGSLNVAGIRDYVARLLNIRQSNESHVQKLEVSGRYPDSTSDHLDLIENLMEEVVDMEPAADRTLPYGSRRAEVRGAWHRRRDEITQMHGSSGS